MNCTSWFDGVGAGMQAALEIHCTPTTHDKQGNRKEKLIKSVKDTRALISCFGGFKSPIWINF